jgi:hypothetical protein
MKYIKRFQLNENEEPEFDYDKLFNKEDEQPYEPWGTDDSMDYPQHNPAVLAESNREYNKEVVNSVGEVIDHYQEQIRMLEYGLSIMEKDFNQDITYTDQLETLMKADKTKYNSKEMDIIDQLLTIIKQARL